MIKNNYMWNNIFALNTFYEVWMTVTPFLYYIDLLKNKQFMFKTKIYDFCNIKFIA